MALPALPRLFALLALLLGAGAGPLAADLADDLARISVEAAGGVSAHAGLRSFRAVGVTRVGEREVPFILYAARPARLRIETVGEKGSLVRATDGVHAPWKKDDPLQPPRRLSPAEERDFLLDADFDSPLFEPASRGISLDYGGEATVDGRPCRKLLALLRRSELVTLYIDDETLLLTRRDQTKNIRGRELLVETRYEDFRPVKGVRLPHRIRILVDGRPASDTRIEAIDPHPGFPPDLFSPPAKDWPLR